MTTTITKCYRSHPPLPVGDGKVIYGGNGEHPVVHDADVYVSLDYFTPTKMSWPWNPGEHISFKIVDQNVPKDHGDFKDLIRWLSEQLDLGKKVHVGCIGGHGRTGMVFAALVAFRKVSDDPIKYVRENYCKKAVESQKQVNYLVAEWGCKTAEARPMFSTGSKGHSSHKGITDQYDFNLKNEKVTGHGSSKPIYSSEKKSGKVTLDSHSPYRGEATIWSKRVTSTVASSTATK